MIDIVTPVHPARVLNGMLTRAAVGVAAQTAHCRWIIERDDTGAGATATRNAGLARVEADWVAFLDSDDELEPFHLQRLADHAARTGADLVYPWFTRAGLAPDPWPERFGRPFDAVGLRRANYIPITVLVRTELLRAVGGFRRDRTLAPPAECEEWGTWLRLLDAGARFAHLPERTWTWHVHGANTSGSPRLGDAKVRRAVPAGPHPA